jgi:hypothetical protein
METRSCPDLMRGDRETRSMLTIMQHRLPGHHRIGEPFAEKQAAGV